MIMKRETPIEKILFVWTGNAGCSLMAKFLLEHMARRHANPKIQRLRVDSAGTFASPSPDPELYPALEQLSVTRVTHTPKQITKELFEAADLVLTMTHQHKRTIQRQWPSLAYKIHTFKEYVGEEGDIEDIAGHGAKSYVEMGKEFQRLINSLFEKIAQQ